jgi:hypothetical protein
MKSLFVGILTLSSIPAFAETLHQYIRSDDAKLTVLSKEILIKDNKEVCRLKLLTGPQNPPRNWDPSMSYIFFTTPTICERLKLNDRVVYVAGSNSENISEIVIDESKKSNSPYMKIHLVIKD